MSPKPSWENLYADAQIALEAAQTALEDISSWSNNSGEFSLLVKADIQDSLARIKLAIDALDLNKPLATEASSPSVHPTILEKLSQTQVNVLSAKWINCHPYMIIARRNLDDAEKAVETVITRPDTNAHGWLQRYREAQKVKAAAEENLLKISKTLRDEFQKALLKDGSLY